MNMAEKFCSICGISGKMRDLFEVISPKGIVLACEKCISEEGFPILRKPDKRVFEEADKKSRVSEVMERLTGVRPKEQERRRDELRSGEKTLREIVDKRYEEKTRMQGLGLKPRPDLVDNFHWIIMRVRRLRGLTQQQLAESIGEAESAIKMAEQGLVPHGYGLIDKLERFLKVKLIKERNFHDHYFGREQLLEKNKLQPKIQENVSSQPSQPKKTISFDRKSIDSLTISDLRRMKIENETKNIMLMEKQDKKDAKEKTEKVFGEKEEETEEP